MKLRSEVRLFSYHGAPVLAHWSLLLAFPIAWVSEKDFLGAIVAQAAFFVLMLAHELGHAFVARRLRLPVFSVRLYLVHGQCHYGAPRREAADVAVAWGGVAAQAMLFVLALLLAKSMSLAGGIPRALAPAFDVWIPINMLVAFCNLLPIATLDGSKAWRFIPMGFSAAIGRFKSRKRQRRPERVGSQSTGRVVSMELHRIGKRDTN